MNSIVPNSFLGRIFPISYFTPLAIRNWLFVALSTILTLGMIFSYALGAPWGIPLLFFGLALAALYPVNTLVKDPISRIKET